MQLAEEEGEKNENKIFKYAYFVYLQEMYTQ